MINFILRKPIYPIICCLDDNLIAAISDHDINMKLRSIGSFNVSQYDMFDATGEGWVFYPKFMAISPICLKRKWTKKEIITLYNNSPCAQQTGAKYPEKSLSAKKLRKIITEIAELILSAHQNKTFSLPPSHLPL